jgi:Zn-dependent peptidase ImmA (M78 family)/DNA-binding XRE family transcriptional regulator
VELNKAKFSSFVPERLKEGREARGLTLMELAEFLEISHQAVSKYEKGKNIPTPDILEKITNTLDLPLSFFLKPTSSLTEEVVFFRSRAAATVKSKKIHSYRINWLSDIHKYLEQILDFPKLSLPSYNDNNKYSPVEFEEIDELAMDLRKIWGLGNGPISNVSLLLEKQGIIISKSNLSDIKIDACSKWKKLERPYILLGNQTSSACRTRFDLAHELGHLVLHANLDKSEFNKKDIYTQIEKEANRFASAFLLPEPTFAQEVYSNSLDHFINLKERWNVSIAAMLYRAEQLNILSEYQVQYLRKKMAYNNMRTKEPLDDVLPFERPSALRQAIELIIENNVKTKQDLIYEIGFLREEIEELANLEPFTLLEEKEKTNVVKLKFK